MSIKSGTKGTWINKTEFNVLDGRFKYYITCSVCFSRFERLVGSSRPTKCPTCESEMECKKDD